MAIKPKGNARAPGPNVRYKRDELRALLPQYELIRDCLLGEVAVKRKTTKYLPKPEPDNISPQAEARYTAYLTRAVFYNATRRTLNGLLGEVFAIDPVITVPDALAPVLADGSGGGVTLIQQAKDGALNGLAFARAGLFIDYPRVEGPTTREELGKDIRPTITVYEPWNIINWRTMKRGSSTLLNLVVLEEDAEVEDDGFETKTQKQWRVLRLIDNVYMVEIWKLNASGGSVDRADETTIPLDGNGNPLTEIPFKFIGGKNNDPVPDDPILYDLASINMAHYRNSADQEEASFTVGQPTYIFSGLTVDWVNNVIGKRIETGSRTAIALPAGADGKILQPQANTMPKDGMEQKERQMVALGAKLVEQRSVQRTAKEAGMDQRTESSVLATVANNVSDAFTWALIWCARFMRIPETNIKFECNTDFAINRLSPEDQAQLIALWQGGDGLVTFEEARYGLKKTGIATEDDAEARKKIDAEAKKRSERKITEIKAAKPAPTATKPPAKAAA